MFLEKDKRHFCKKIWCVGLAAGVLSMAIQGCALPEQIEQVVGTVKQNIELQGKMDSLELPKEVESISGEKYVYGTLSKEDQVVYDQMLDAVNRQENEVTLSTTDGKHLQFLFECMKADYGGLFWVESFRYTQYQKNGKTQMLTFTPDYTMSLEKRRKLQARIDKKAAAFLKGIDADASDYEKALYVYRKLIRKVDYNLEAENNQNIISVFLNRETVCQGYASATQYLLDQLGIPCVIVSGMANGGSHAWNLVKLDGEWYWMDTTWGNSAYHDEEENKVKYVQYDYLNITSGELQHTHKPNTGFPLPDCTANEDNFYVREHRFFSALEEVDIASIGELVRTAYEGGKKSVSVKFSDGALCAQAKDYFLTDYHIQDYCPKLSSVYYHTNEQLNIFTILFP